MGRLNLAVPGQLKRLLGGDIPLVDFNDHGLPLPEDSKDNRSGTSGGDAHDVPFPGWLVEAVASLERSRRLTLSCDGRRPFENEAELTAGVIVLWAGRFPGSLNDAHDELKIACPGNFDSV